MKIKETKDVVCMFVDSGLFAEIAVQASNHFKHLYFYNPSQINPFPSSKDVTIGTGFENITVIQNFEDYKGSCDLFWYPDIFQGAQQEELKSQGFPVWGLGETEWLERDRFKANEWQKKSGLPTPERIKVVGIDEARKLPKGWHLKINDFRDDAETFKKLGNPLMESFWDKLSLTLGHRKNTYEFMAEKDIPDAVEAGVDIYTVNGKYPKFGLCGIEEKGAGYAGKITLLDGLPPSLKKVNDELKKVFTEEKTKTNFSTEVRVTEDQNGYLIDPCMRLGNPPHQSEMEIIGNMPEIAWAGANGDLVEPEIKARYCAQTTMTSEFAEEGEIAFEIPEKIKQFVKIKNVCKNDGTYYFIQNKGSKINTVGSIIGLGNTLDEAIKNCKENASQVKAFGLEIDIYALDDLKKEIIKSYKYGINLS